MSPFLGCVGAIGWIYRTSDYGQKESYEFLIEFFYKKKKKIICEWKQDAKRFHGGVDQVLHVDSVICKQSWDWIIYNK